MEGGGQDMELPEAASLVGKIEENRIIYIEDYALQYLKALRKEGVVEGDKFALYGTRRDDEGKEVYIIYGICGLGEQQYNQEKTDQGYEWIGELEAGRGRAGEEPGKIFLTGRKNSRHPVSGYYIFYDENDKMKARLGEYYEECVNRGRYKEATGKKAELVALSMKEQSEEISLYTWIRIAVTAILIIFCAIAVTTINEYDKMSNFAQAAVHTGEMIEEFEKN